MSEKKQTIKVCQLPVPMNDSRCNTYCMMEAGHVGKCEPAKQVEK